RRGKRCTVGRNHASWAEGLPLVFKRQYLLLPIRLTFVCLRRRVVQLLFELLQFDIDFIALLRLFGSSEIQSWLDKAEAHAGGYQPGIAFLIAKRRIIEESDHLVVLLLGERIVLMVVALRATQTGTQPGCADSVGAVDLRVPVVFLGVRPAFALQH